MSYGNLLGYLCYTTKRANKFWATNIAKQQTITTANKLNCNNHKSYYKNGIYIFAALNHGCTTTQNVMQKRMAILNGLSFVTEDLPCWASKAQGKPTHISRPATLRQCRRLLVLRGACTNKCIFNVSSYLPLFCCSKTINHLSSYFLNIEINIITRATV